MELWIKAAWLALTAVHVPPALVVFMPSLVTRLYGVDPEGPVATLLVHRGVLFLSVCIASVFALLDPATRLAGSLVVGTSIIGFLILYAMAGWPPGPLRMIALFDIAALLPLTLVATMAWRS